MKTFRTTGTGSEQTLSEIETDKIPLYPSEQDLLDDLANLEVGQIAGTIDPAESELIGVLIQRIQALESKLESDDVYSTEEVKTNKKWIDGKPIYRKAYQGSLANGTVIVSANVDKLVSCGGHFKGAGDELIPIPFGISSGYLYPAVSSSNIIKINATISYSGEIWVEYTKTSA